MKSFPLTVFRMLIAQYQKEFLAWGVAQERGPVRGGILADEMGMGKTIQVLLPCCPLLWPPFWLDMDARVPAGNCCEAPSWCLTRLRALTIAWRCHRSPCWFLGRPRLLPCPAGHLADSDAPQ